jgi:hypothetical protein
MDKIVECPHCGFGIICNLEEEIREEVACFECGNAYKVWIEVSVKTMKVEP